jgi:hypothetical protein
MNYLKRLLRTIVSEVYEEHHKTFFTSYRLIDSETGHLLTSIDLLNKPSEGDIIDCQDGNDQRTYWRVRVERIQYSSTGFTGELKVKKLLLQ